ncbi:hypothetical protein SB861_61055, partial [Paraburkholderia sp. SIMBA_049]
MPKPMNLSKKKTVTSLLVIIISTLSACDKYPSEHLKALTEDKYPVANMPDEPLETPLEINIEPKRLEVLHIRLLLHLDDAILNRAQDR